MDPRTTSLDRTRKLDQQKLMLSGNKCVSIGQDNAVKSLQGLLINSPVFALNNEPKPRVDGEDEDGCLLCINLNNWLVLADPILCDPLVHHSFYTNSNYNKDRATGAIIRNLAQFEFLFVVPLRSNDH